MSNLVKINWCWAWTKTLTRSLCAENQGDGETVDVWRQRYASGLCWSWFISRWPRRKLRSERCLNYSNRFPRPGRAASTPARTSTRWKTMCTRRCKKSWYPNWRLHVKFATSAWWRSWTCWAGTKGSQERSRSWNSGLQITCQCISISFGPHFMQTLCPQNTFSIGESHVSRSEWARERIIDYCQIKSSGTWGSDFSKLFSAFILFFFIFEHPVPGRVYVASTAGSDCDSVTMLNCSLRCLDDRFSFPSSMLKGVNNMIVTRLKIFFFQPEVILKRFVPFQGI